MSEIDLSKYVPYTLKIDQETSKISEASGLNITYSTRTLFDIKDVIYDLDWLNAQRENIDLYYMYRDLTREQDKTLFKKYKIRFDITIIPPNKLGKEYVKTAGHFHPIIKNDIGYPEIYEVMHGKALYLLQKETKKKKDQIEIIIIPAKAGDQVLIPPSFGHVTVNPTTTDILVMNNLVSSEFNSKYDFIKKKNGAVYLYHTNETWIRNPTYKQKILVKEKSPLKLSEKPFYHSFLENPEQWIFLNEPWKRNTWL
ncbi:MAG TPA: glucose-6-phosphate isomerase family protein [Candidatus Bathyarchaeia archaeon]|nr:glucose-6-phosphate isomerase family protein [Candidatus Bathyarchaeia archaeon]